MRPGYRFAEGGLGLSRFCGAQVANTARYFSQLKRQRNKLKHAPLIVRAFERAVAELDANPSQTELARWLTERRVKPSAGAKATSKWVAQTVTDWLTFDGERPTLASVVAHTEEYWKLKRNDISTKKLTREAGFRIVILHEWRSVWRNIEADSGTLRLEHDKRNLEQHLANIAEAAWKLRNALLIPQHSMEPPISLTDF